MKTELTPEDRARIAKQANEYTKDWPLSKLPANKVAFRHGAEYATRFERQQQADERSELREKVIDEVIEKILTDEYFAHSTEELDFEIKRINDLLNSLKTKP